MITALSVWSVYHALGILGASISKKDSKYLAMSFCAISWMAGAVTLFANFPTLFLIGNFSLIAFMFMLSLVSLGIAPPGPEKAATANAFAAEIVIRAAVSFTCWTLI